MLLATSARNVTKDRNMFIVQAPVATTVNYDCKMFIVQATELQTLSEDLNSIEFKYLSF
jgi:hypothetical protein